MHHYSMNIMIDIVLAYCILHNFLRMMNNDESLLEEVDRNLMQGDIDVSHSQIRENDYRLGSQIRDTIENMDRLL